MRFSELVERFVLRDPSHARDDATLTLEATLLALAERLPHALGRELLAVLPKGMPFARESPVGSDGDYAGFYVSIAQRTGFAIPVAIERAQQALTVLGACLDPELRVRFEKELPPELGRLLSSRPSAPPAPHTRAGRHEQTLANGRPGSEHPLSESSSGSRHPVASSHAERAQGESIARADNPHADSKLGSTRGSTQEREHEALADGRPRPRR